MPCPLCRGCKYMLNTEAGHLYMSYLFEGARDDGTYLYRKKCTTCGGTGAVVYANACIVPVDVTADLPTLPDALAALRLHGVRVYVEENEHKKSDVVSERTMPKKIAHLKPGVKVGLRTLRTAPVWVNERWRVVVKCACGREDTVQAHSLVARAQDSCRECAARNRKKK